MTRSATMGNSSPDDVVAVTNVSGAGDFLIVCEHASKYIPASYGGLGLDEAALESHIAWDPGALPVAHGLSALLDAPLIAQNYSRLLYDCNRPPSSLSAIPVESEVYLVPGNTDLSQRERDERIARYYAPFRDQLAATIDDRVRASRPPVMVTVHSFTPVYKGERRSTDLGILHDADGRFADALLAVTLGASDLAIHRNRPYGPEDGVTHTLIEHALPRGLLNVMLEIRNDLVADSSSQARMAAWLSNCLAQALTAVGDSSRGREIA